jgi:hypothetical protein
MISAKINKNSDSNKNTLQPCEGFLDKLANGWNKGQRLHSSDALNKLEKRNYKKHLTRKFVIPLVNLHSPMEKGYWNTYYCNDVLEQEGKKIIGHYCGNRWCYICNGIRTAKLINAYKPVVDEWNNPVSLVLTVKNVPATVLDVQSKVKEMNEEFRKITDLLRNRDGVQVEAIRTIEVTSNWRAKTSHPHFHILLNGYWIGKLILEEWIKHFPEDEVNRGGQSLKKANKWSLNELFKYITKFNDGTPALVLDVIFQALKGMKIVSPTGVKKVPEEIAELISVEIPELDNKNRLWWWNPEAKDWITRICWPEPEGLKLCEFIKKRIALYSP